LSRDTQFRTPIDSLRISAIARTLSGRRADVSPQEFTTFRVVMGLFAMLLSSTLRAETPPAS
jgi:hypothetical protein